MVQTQDLTDLVLTALEDMKGIDIRRLDVRGITSITDWMVIASGTSDRHVKSLAGRIAERAREAGVPVLGMEGEADGDWVLIDLGDVIAHVMLPKARDFYQLEKLWQSGGESALRAES